MNSRREVFRALKNHIKLNWHRKYPLKEKTNKRGIAVASVAALGSAALAINSSHTQVIDEDSNKALGAIYKFQEEIDELPLVYDVAQINEFWQKRTFEVIRRTAEIVSVLGPYFCKLVIWEYLIRQKIREHEGLQKKYAIKLREILTDLGVTCKIICFLRLFTRSSKLNFSHAS